MSRRIRATVRDRDNQIRAKVRDRDNQIRAKSSVVVANSFKDFDDIEIDPDPPLDGSLLVYEADSEKWKSTINLFKQNIDAGEF